jgi:hypothetical protein
MAPEQMALEMDQPVAMVALVVVVQDLIMVAMVTLLQLPHRKVIMVPKVGMTAYLYLAAAVAVVPEQPEHMVL